ncbi:MAG: hypothetical protein JWM16_375 [Verrucomicrobiales bacterium]|nr:hypothetical protein [Verrucomicrobiales bacterium]
MPFAFRATGIRIGIIGFWQDPAELVLNDFPEGNISNAKTGRIQDHRSAAAARTGIELPHAARNEVNKYVGVSNLRYSLFTKFTIQVSLSFLLV